MAILEGVRPTLLVGVGGTGCDIAERVHRVAMAEGVNRNHRIGIIGLDTDANDMRRLKQLDQRSRIQFSTPDTVYRLLDKHPDLERTWFGPRSGLSHSVQTMSLVDGAAQIRLLTRLALHDTLARGDLERRVGDELAALARHRSSGPFEGTVNVLLVGSLAGATGSGCFLQVALLLAEIGRARNIPVDVRGLFLLPDIFVRGASLPRDQIQSVLANAYAALKELNAVNNLTTGVGEQTDFSFEFAPGRHIAEGGKPFRSVALLDFENTRGGSYGRDFDAYKTMSARIAFQLIFSPIGEETASRSINNSRADMAAAAKGTHNIFAGAGISAIEYPVREIAQYLTLRLAQDSLGGDWLRLDRAFFDRVRRYEQQRADGVTSATAPDQARSYLEDLDTLAKKDRIAFFVEVRGRLFPEVRSEPGAAPEEQPRHLSFLARLQAELIDRFWSVERLAEIKARQILDVTNLKNKNVLTDSVRRLELQLNDDLAALDRALRTVPDDLFTALLLTGDDLLPSDWRDYHLQSYIIKGGPHLVEVRAFLYALGEAIAVEKSSLNADAVRERVMRAANVFDDARGPSPQDRGSPAVIKKARAAATRRFYEVWKPGPEQFIADYVTYYNGSLTSLRSYAEQQLRWKALDLLEAEVRDLSRTLGGLFVELQGILSGLTKELAQEEARHAASAGLVNGNVPVYADAAAKQQIWEDVSRRAVGLRLGEDANMKLTRAIYGRYREDRRERRPVDIAAVGRLFASAITEDFARREVETSFRSSYDLSIVAAVKRQAALLGEAWEEQLRRLVDLVSSQSEPFLSLGDAADGQKVIYWAVNPQVREDIADRDLYAGLFTFQQGEQPLEAEEFSRHELLCMNSRVNLELRHLAKLFPPAAGARNVNRPTQGAYAQAYEAMIDDIVNAELAGAAARSFTPHLDCNWHRPGTLPEIFPEQGAAIRRDKASAFVLGLALGLISFVSDYGRRVTEFSTVGKGGGGGTHARLAETHDAWEVAKALDRRADLVRATRRLWSELEGQFEQGRTPAGDPTAALLAPAVLAQLLRISVNRQEGAVRDAKVVEFVGAWAAMLRRLAALSRPDLAEPGQQSLVEAWIGTARVETFGLLAADGIREETLRVLDRLCGQGLESFAGAAADS